MSTYSSQAGLASFRPTPQPATIHAAVIEWGDEQAPSLFIGRTEAAVLADVRIATGEELPEARTLAEYQLAYHDTDPAYFISIHETEV